MATQGYILSRLDGILASLVMHSLLKEAYDALHDSYMTAWLATLCNSPSRITNLRMVTARIFLLYILRTRLLSRIHNTHKNFVNIHSVHRKYEVLHGHCKSSLPIQSWCRIWIQIQDCYKSWIRNTFRLQGTRLSNNLYSQIQYRYNINTGQVCGIVLPKRVCFAYKAIHSHICVRHFCWCLLLPY
jgi:hypothetical protein